MDKKVAIMQPYFCPYIGYFQLMDYVDEFIIYDNIQYTKKGWINRNRIIENGKDSLLTLPLKNGPSKANVINRELSYSWTKERDKIYNRIYNLYKKAPHFKASFEVIEDFLFSPDTNLFNYILNSIKRINTYLNINTNIVISSTLDIDHGLKSQDKVLALCKEVKATHYINPIGGVKLYVKDTFFKQQTYLNFLKTDNIIYPQFNNDFIPFLSIIDVMMFNHQEDIQNNLLKSYTII